MRAALRLASNDSRSPQETRLRLVWVHDARLAPPLCNMPVFSKGGRLLGYPDLFDPVSGTLGEYDGEDHKGRERHRADVAREQLFRNHGLEYFAIVGGDLSDRRLVVDRIHGTRGRARFDRPEDRVWTLEPPPWWQPVEDLDTYLVRIGEAPWLVRT